MQRDVALPCLAVGLTALVATAACGSKTGLLNPDFGAPAASNDAGARPDVTFDPDAPPLEPSFTFEEPYLGTPTPGRSVLPLGSSLKQVDVAVVMDTTGSMAGSISNLKSNLTTRIFPALIAAIPSVGIAVVDHKDYPVSPFGSSGDFPVRIIQGATTDVAKAQEAVGFYLADGGSDGPEAQIPAMFHTLTGASLRWRGGELSPHVSAPGRWGGADFRPGSLAVVVEITDVDWHDAANSPYDANISSPPSLVDLEGAFNRAGARFIDVTNGAMEAPEEQANALSDATRSNISPDAFGGKCGVAQCCTGIAGAARPPLGPSGTCRLNFLHSNGDGVSASIVTAIQAISVGYTLDVIAIAHNDPHNADGVDATDFIRALRAIEEGDSGAGCLAHPAKDTDGDGVKDTFVSVVVGTNVCFEVLPRVNDKVKPKAVDQFFVAYIEVLGIPGSVKLDRRAVQFKVPAAK